MKRYAIIGTQLDNCRIAVAHKQAAAGVLWRCRQMAVLRGHELAKNALEHSAFDLPMGPHIAPLQGALSL